MNIANTPEYAIARLKDQVAANNVLFALERLAPHYGSNYHAPGCVKNEQKTLQQQLDLLETLELREVIHDTVCVYDLKTGNKGITIPRAIEIYESVRRRFVPMPEVRVVEVNPSR